MAIGGAMVTHYVTVWPCRDGHNAGYCMPENGTLKKPGIRSFSEDLQKFGAEVNYRSSVWMIATLDLGSLPNRERAWALVPGWMSDFVVSENRQKRPR